MDTPALDDREALLAGEETGYTRASRLVRAVTRFGHDTRGATAIEYALIAGLIFLVIVGSIELFATRVDGVYQRIGDAVNSAG